MKILIIYDSVFGNTEQIARAIGKAFDAAKKAETYHVSDIKPDQLSGLDILIVGSPTRAFRPTKAITNFLNRIPPDSLKNVYVAGFDTGISAEDSQSALLKRLIKIFGYAAKPITEKLQKKGGQLIIEPEGFFVQASEGPLKEHELDRAAEWANRIMQKQ